MHELMYFGWSFCLFRLLTLKKTPVITLGREMKILFSYGFWYLIILILCLFISNLLK
jgi:hypothetical protein